MKKLSDFQGEEALDLLADLIEPASEIMADPKMRELIEGKNKGAIVKALIKNHKKQIIEILAIIDGVPVEEYKVNVFTIPLKLLDILNDKELVDFFTSQEQMEEQTASIGSLETITDPEE